MNNDCHSYQNPRFICNQSLRVSNTLITKSMLDLDGLKSDFEQFATDSLNALNTSAKRNQILSYNGNAAWGNLHSFYQESITGRSFAKLKEILSGDRELEEMYGMNFAQLILFRFIDNMIILASDSRLDWLAFNDKVFAEIFLWLKQELYESDWTYVAISPDVTNFRSDRDTIDFGDGVQIRGRNDEVLTLMGWDRAQQIAFWNRLRESGWSSQYVLFIIEKVKKKPDNIVLSSTGYAFAAKENLLACLRLYKAGSISADVQYYGRVSNYFKILGMTSSGSPSHTILHAGPEYVLNSTHLEDFMNFRKGFMEFVNEHLSKNESVALALRYFNATYTSNIRNDDRVLECITALEALFKLDQELAFKLSFRTAFLLAITHAERVAIFKDIKDFYNLRSHIVHGSGLKSKDYQTLANVEKLVEYVRKCLRLFINLAKVEPSLLTQEFYDSVDIKLIDEEERKMLQQLL